MYQLANPISSLSFITPLDFGVVPPLIGLLNFNLHFLSNKLSIATLLAEMADGDQALAWQDFESLKDALSESLVTVENCARLFDQLAMIVENSNAKEIYLLENAILNCLHLLHKLNLVQTKFSTSRFQGEVAVDGTVGLGLNQVCGYFTVTRESFNQFIKENPAIKQSGSKAYAAFKKNGWKRHSLVASGYPCFGS